MGPLIITINGETLEELKKKIINIAGEFGISCHQKDCPPEQLHLPLVTEAEANAAVAKTLNKNNPTISVVTDSAKAVNERCGLAALRNLLGTFTAQRLSELKVEDYSAFHAACERLIESAPEVEETAEA